MPLILRLAQDCVCPSCQEIKNQRPHAVASLEAIPPNCQNIQIDQAERSHATDSLKARMFRDHRRGMSSEGGQDAFSHEGH